LPLSVSQIYAMIHVNMWSAIRTLWTTTWHGIIVWCVAAPVFTAVVYAVLAPLFRRVAGRLTSPPVEAI
jgi:type IV secretory pathway TrbD component